MPQSSSQEHSNHQDLADVFDSAVLFFVNDCLPGTASKEWAEAKRLEIVSDISPDVLYATNEDGSRSIDKEYTGGFLLLLRDVVRDAKTLQGKQSTLDTASKLLGTRRKPKDILTGRYGKDAQQAFLAGALMFAEVAIQAELFERNLREA